MRYTIINNEGKEVHSPEYKTLAWMGQTWLPAILMAFTLVGVLADMDFAFIGTLISGGLIPIINKIKLDVKRAALNPKEFFEPEE